MRGLALCLLILLAAAAAWLWGAGGADIVARWTASTQREVQNAMARSLRALQSGDLGALATLWGLCLTYGFVHAAGPGHGKLVIGGYGVAARVAARRLAGLAILSSLAQAVFAIVVVYAAIWMFGWGRAQLTEAADKTMAPLSYAMITGIGVFLMIRGMRKLWQHRQSPMVNDPVGDHDHDHSAPDGTCSSCGHKHAPSVEDAAQVASLRDALVVIISIAIRPCTGAVFLLILTHALGLVGAGIIGVLIMGLGTAAFTGIVALAAVGARESTLAQVASTQATARLLAVVETAAGFVLAVLTVQLLMRVL